MGQPDYMRDETEWLLNHMLNVELKKIRYDAKMKLGVERFEYGKPDDFDFEDLDYTVQYCFRELVLGLFDV